MWTWRAVDAWGNPHQRTTIWPFMRRGDARVDSVRQVYSTHRRSRARSGLTTRTTISWPDARNNPGTLHGMQYELVLTSVK